MILKSGKGELLGRSNQQKVDVAQMRGVFGDIHSQYVSAVYGDFESKKSAFIESAKASLGRLAKFLGDKKYTCGEITYVDFLWAEFFSILDMIDDTIVGSFDNLRQLEKRIWEEPSIKSYTSSDRF